jgi:hypothetical protein
LDGWKRHREGPERFDDRGHREHRVHHDRQLSFQPACQTTRGLLKSIRLVGNTSRTPKKRAARLGQRRTVRNVSTTLIQPGSEFKLNSMASVGFSDGLGAWLPAVAVRGSAHHRAWVRVASRNGTQWRQPSKRKAAETVVTDTMPGRRKARGRSVTSKRPWSAFRRLWAWGD